MTGGSLSTAMVSLMLVSAPLPLVPPEPLPPGAAPASPCPTAELDPAPQVPEQPSPPPPAPDSPRLGGAALTTPDLAIPRDADPPPATALSADTWLVADLDTGAVLGACGAHQHAIPASTQKLLLAATFLAELDPEATVEVTDEDLWFEPGSSAVGLLSGGVYSVETLWLGLLLSSGNDAANVLARLGGGEEGVDGGLRRMNEYARQLGAYRTHAATPSGLDGPGQFTSAYDLALIARQLYDREDFLRYVGTERATVPPQPPQDPDGFEIQNRDGLLAEYDGALGGKSGFTTLARHSYVGAAERDGRRLVATLLGAEARPGRGWQQAAVLLDWGFELPPHWAVGQLVEPRDLVDVTAGSPAESAGDDPGALSPTTQTAPPVGAPDTPVAEVSRGAGGTVAAVGSVALAGAMLAAMVWLLTRPRRAGRELSPPDG